MNPVFVDAVNAIRTGIVKRAGGSAGVWADRAMPGTLTLQWTYNCPCGELSNYRQVYEERHNLPVDWVELNVECALSAMRRHVREEGNEPNF